MSWRPSAGIAALRQRAAILARLRAFFAARGVLEVETPALSAATVTDLHLHSLSVELEVGGERCTRYLQTSPEFAMKRLLAAGSGPIFQLARAFRADERGRLHNPEFTMLEWYRPDFDHHALMDEMDALLGALLGCPRAERRSYRQAFAEALGLDPLRAENAELRAALAGRERVGFDGAERDDLLHLLMNERVESTFAKDRPTFVYDYPASMAALARVRPAFGEEPAVAERFEVYWGAIELANGFHELADAAEQRRRFEADLHARANRGLPAVPIDEHLLAALAFGLPDCAGVALGVDRLVMIALGAQRLDDVVAFTIDRA